jgi:hypothetical protein
VTAFADRTAWAPTTVVPFVVPATFDPKELMQLLRAAPLQNTPPADGDPGDSCDCENCR